ncbi:S-adenosyl-l-methionine hydroxide adenosyltransferase family protein [Bacillus ginsengihumi]|uniref:S-adenosyl-l-methionine hydroxide adenosyltransferase family protein n=1 Tax=Heyndrickxia ginsengihumi TaxID=363870 RepID=A0A6M0P2U3_9BACI|nr:S-adenosyl-l-methionine hydroxide adenosyltransferase family protein [Heyndrickxia ginsengihumi]
MKNGGVFILNKQLVIQTDFGTCDGAVSAMYGVAVSVDPTLRISDLTHEIPQYNIWEASYRLYQTISYWPEETVFVSVVDPGVGSERRSIAVKTATNHYIITPDNGTLTHIKESVGIIEARIIDEHENCLPQTGNSYTFYGRDLYAYTSARLAANILSFEEIGATVPVESIVELPKKRASLQDQTVVGNIDILDVRFGNLWTNIDEDLFKQLEVTYGDLCEVTIENDARQVYKHVMTFGRSFADTHVGEPLLYINSLYTIGVAINQGSFAKAYHIGAGAQWKITVRKVSPGILS